MITVQLLTCSSSSLNHKIVTFSEEHEIIQVKPKLEDFWLLETIGIKDCPVESDDEKALMKFNETIKFEKGRYLVSWPWRTDYPELPANYRLAYGRL